jgi:HPr kinase/phosphorylase
MSPFRSSDHVTIADLLAHLPLAVRPQGTVSAAALARRVNVPRIQKPGLALAGWPEQLHQNRVLVLGGTEIDYLDAAAATAREVGIATLLASEPACIVVCRGRNAPADLIAAADARTIPVLTSDLVTAEFIAEVTSWLGVRLAPSSSVHGVLIDVLGIGVLVMGKSGIGKSETALDLVVRGHRLIADDVVMLRRTGTTVTGLCAKTLGHHMEIRGLGVINIKDLFGISAVRDSKKVELVVELVEWSNDDEYDRLGVDDHTIGLLDVNVPRVRLPVRPGRNLATLIEVAARNQRLKEQGHHSARAFHAALAERMITVPPRDNDGVD